MLIGFLGKNNLNKLVLLSLATSNGLRNSLSTSSTKCTMVFRIHFCNDNQHCPVPLCSTFGREEGKILKFKIWNWIVNIKIVEN